MLRNNMLARHEIRKSVLVRKKTHKTKEGKIYKISLRTRSFGAFVVVLSLRKPAGHRFRQLLWSQTPSAEDHCSWLCADVHRHLHHCSASLHHRAVSNVDLEHRRVAFDTAIQNHHPVCVQL